MKIIAFAASNSTQSINKKLVAYASIFLTEKVEILDLNDFECPLFSQDKENESGHPQAAHDFLAKIQSADGILISFAEHNGSFTAAYKNLFDWCSRIQAKVYEGKPVVLLSTSPGARGGASVLEAAKNAMPYFGALVKSYMSVNHFYEQFDLENNCLKDPIQQKQLQEVVSELFSESH